MKLKILVGTMTDTAQRVAQAIQLDCADWVAHIDIQRMDGLDISVFDEDALFLICCSTYGSGDVPDNAHELYQSLDSQPRYLGHVRYGVIALGDSIYLDTFCHGGKRFDERLSDLGARRLGELLCLDASLEPEPEAAGARWCREWLAQATSSA